jgi:hypothetical protein
MNKNRPAIVFKYWLPVAFAVTFTCFVAYLVAQQVMRYMASDPQIQIAEDLAAAPEQGRNSGDTTLNCGNSKLCPRNSDTVDMAHSVAPFVILYDEQGQPVASAARLDGGVPTPPHGVFDFTRDRGEDRVTWQPRPGVRIAAVIVHHGGTQPGFVLAGRSLRDSERRTSRLGVLLLALWVVTLLGTFFLIVIITWLVDNAEEVKAEVEVEKAP